MTDPLTPIFHIDWRLMIAQLVNFLIVVLVLWYFAIKPLNKKMEERSRTIKQSLKEAAEISQQLKETAETKEATLKLARLESQKIVEQARQLAEQEKEKGLQATRQEVAEVVKQGKAQLVSEKEQVIKEVKEESADLVVAAVKKVLAELADEKIDEGLIEKVLKKVN